MLRTLDERPLRGILWQDAISSPEPRVTQPTGESAPTEEAEWLAAARAGDRPAFARVVDLYWERLYRWLFHLTRDRHQAEDLTQETFLKALAALQSFRPGSNFRAWLFRIGHNNFVNLKRAGRKMQGTLPDDAESAFAPAPADAMADKEALAAVQAAIAKLPPDFRAALMLHTQEGLSYREVAAILKTTEETARWRVFKARQKLMSVLNPDLLPPSG